MWSLAIRPQHSHFDDDMLAKLRNDPEAELSAAKAALCEMFWVGALGANTTRRSFRLLQQSLHRSFGTKVPMRRVHVRSSARRLFVDYADYRQCPAGGSP